MIRISYADMIYATCIQCNLDGADTKVEIEREDGVVGVCHCHSTCKDALVAWINLLHVEAHGMTPEIVETGPKRVLS